MTNRNIEDIPNLIRSKIARISRFCVCPTLYIGAWLLLSGSKQPWAFSQVLTEMGQQYQMQSEFNIVFL
jgi:hypothetical protein